MTKWNKQDLVMEGVREHHEHFPASLVRNGGRICVLARNECNCNSTAVDLDDLVEWMRYGPSAGRIDGGFFIGEIDNAAID